jgi:multidrug efflux system outer membrane protein
MSKTWLLALVALLCAGCLLGPDYQRPTVETPPGWRSPEQAAVEAADAAWWEQFGDPRLNELVVTALQGNIDVMLAAARIRELSAGYEVRRSALWPQAEVIAGVANQRLTEKGATPLPSNAGVQNPATLHGLGSAAAWELDLWGRLRRTSEAAWADLLAGQENRRAVAMSLVASVAEAYVNLRSLDKQLEIARSTVESRRRSLRIFTLRFKAGIVSDLQLYQVRSEYEQAMATVPQLERAVTQQENALALLLGQNPGPIARGRELDHLSLPEVPAGLPSDLLNRRPDIQRAEQNLVAANARLGAARAQFFPTISLTGSYGWSSTDLGNFVAGPATVWNLAGSLTAPIFTAGALEGQEKAAEAQRDQALLQYRQSIQNAFRDVEDALVGQRKTREQLQYQERQVQALRSYTKTARLRYDNGYIGYLEVLDAERGLFDAELSYTRTQAALFQALVFLYKAMGGGWVVTAEALSIPGSPGASRR